MAENQPRIESGFIMVKSKKLDSEVIVPVVATTPATTPAEPLRLNKVQLTILSYARDVLRSGQPVKLDDFRQSIAPKLGLKIGAVKTQISGLAKNLKLAGKSLDWSKFGIVASGRGPAQKRPKQAEILLAMLTEQKNSTDKIQLADFRKQFEATTKTKPSSWQGVYTYLRDEVLKTDSLDWNEWGIICKRGRSSADFSAELAADAELMDLLS